jgi:hypothetical protein
MPPLPAVPQVLRCTLKYTLGGDTDLINRFHILYDGGPPTTANLVTLATDIANAWAARIATIFTDGLALEEVTLEDLTSDTSAVGSWTGTQLGTNGSDPLSAGAALVLQMKIARRYRGGHPRIYWGGLDQADLATPQTWSAGALSTWPPLFLDFFADIEAMSAGGTELLNIVNVSYFEGFTPFEYPSGRYRNIPKLRTGGPVVDIVTGFTMNPKVASQRRRNQQRTA